MGRGRERPRGEVYRSDRALVLIVGHGLVGYDEGHTVLWEVDLDLLVGSHCLSVSGLIVGVVNVCQRGKRATHVVAGSWSSRLRSPNWRFRRGGI